MIKSVGIVGLGLIGGSYAALIREQCSECHVFAIDPDAFAYKFALSKGWVDAGYETLLDCHEEPDLIIVCTPLSILASTIKAVSRYFKDQPLLITDVGSVKAFPVSGLSEGHVFIPGHPMGGSDQVGVCNADVALLRDLVYFVVETPGMASFKAFLEQLKFRVVVVSAQSHDEVMAAVSHLPYILSSLLVSAAKQFSEEDIRNGMGPGFRDTSRVSGSSPDWGADVSVMNSKNLIPLIDHVEKELAEIRQLIDAGDHKGLVSFFSKTSEFRRHLYAEM